MNKDFKHTQGTFEYNSTTKNIGVCALNGSINFIANLSNSVAQGDERDSNGRLFAAAPDLLGLLIEINETLASGIEVAIQPGSSFAQKIADIANKACQ